MKRTNFIHPHTADLALSLLQKELPYLTLGDIQGLGDAVQADDKMLKTREAAEILNVHEITVRRMIEAVKIRAFKYGGNLRISHNSIKAMLEDS